MINTSFTFLWEDTDSSISQVYVTGSFNEWNEKIPLKKESDSDKWKVDVNINVNNFQFKYIIERYDKSIQWLCNKTHYNTCFDEKGNENNYFNFSEKEISLNSQDKKKNEIKKDIPQCDQLKNLSSDSDNTISINDIKEEKEEEKQEEKITLQSNDTEFDSPFALHVTDTFPLCKDII